VKGREAHKGTKRQQIKEDEMREYQEEGCCKECLWMLILALIVT